MPQWARHHLIVIAAAVTVLFTNLGGPRLWDRDEPRNAGCAAEMMERGDWVVPVFNGELRTHKPVLLYWLMMTAYATFGVDEFAARFWSAVLGLGTVLMTYQLGRRLFDAQAGLWAALALAPAFMFGVAGRAATPDAVLIFCSTLAIFAYVMLSRVHERSEMHAGEIPHSKHQIPKKSEKPNPKFESCTRKQAPLAGELGQPFTFTHAVVVYAAMGLAILAKGPVGLVLPTAVIGMYLLIVRLPKRISPTPRNATETVATTSTIMQRMFGRMSPAAQVLMRTYRESRRPFAPLHFLRTCWDMRPLTAIGVSLAVALPWYLWVHYRTEGAWTAGFFLEHNLSRATQAMEGHRGNVLFYPAALAIGFFPWSVFLAPMLVDMALQLRRRVANTPGYVFAACWVGVYVVLFSLAKTKLPSYITPCYPGLALLTGAFVSRLARREIELSARWLQLATGVTAVVGLGLLVGLPFVANMYLPGEEWLAAIGIVPLVAGLIGWMLVHQRDYGRLARSYAVAAVAFSTLLLALVPQRVDSHQHNDELLSAIYARSASPTIGHFWHLEPTWVFYGERPLVNVTIAADQQKLTPEKLPAGERRWEKQPKVLLGDFLSQGSDRFVITTRAAWEAVKAEAPADAEVIASTRYFLKKDDLVVVGRQKAAAYSADRPLPARLERFR